MDPSNLDSLHERASEHYLQGDFEAARDAWQQLLQASPDDERAVEGLRQCGLLTAAEPGSSDGTVDDRPFSFDPMSAAAPPPLPEDEIDLGVLDEDPVTETPDVPLEDQEDMESMLIDHEEAPPAPDAPDAPAPDALAETAPTAATPTPDRQGEGIELGNVDELLDLGLDPKLDAPAAAATPPPLPAAEPAAGPQTDPALIPDEGAAESELHMRIQELMLEAHTAADEGRIEEARAVLNRLFILDEDNAPGREFDRKLQEDAQQMFLELDDRVAEGVQMLGYDRPDEAANIFREVLERVPDHEEAKHYLAEAEARIATGETGETGETDAPPEATAPDEPAVDPITPLGDLDAGDGGSTQFDAIVDQGSIPLPETGAEDIALGTTPDTFDPLEGIDGFPDPDRTDLDEPVDEAEPAPRRGPNKLLVGIAAVIVVGAGLFALRGFLPGLSGSADPAQEVVDSLPDAVETVDPAIGAPTQIAEGERSTEELIRQADELAGAVIADMPDEEARRKLAELFAEADIAIEEGNYAEAIIVYNRALQIRPDDPQASNGLREAGELYRDQQAQYAEIDRARRAIRDGDYTAGLRILYRVPRDLKPDEVRDLKVAGWYNLGVMELRSGDADIAITHFEECLALDPTDDAVRRAKDTAEELAGSSSRKNYYAVVERIPFRDVDS